MKIIQVDDVEIEFEKQNKDVSCRWCVYVKVRNKDHDKLLFMIKTNSKPYTRFTMNKGNTVDFMDDIQSISKLDMNIQDEKSSPMPNMFHDKNN